MSILGAPATLPFGAWPSPVTAEVAATAGVQLGSASVDSDDVYWIEGRPVEGGRQVLVRWRAGEMREVAPVGVNVRTRVHEYGGGAYVASGGVVCYVNFADGRLYRAVEGGQPIALTAPGAFHHADAVVDHRRGRLIVVREDRTREGGEPINAVVSVPLSGGESPGEILVAGDDFYAAPRLSPDGTRLCWLSWRHPLMPWDGTDLWVADVVPAGGVSDARLVAGGSDESIFQPGWLGDGSLVFASDRTGWWTLYRWWNGDVAPLLAAPPAAAEFGRPAWIFGSSCWAAAGDDRLVATYTTRGRWRLAVIELGTGALKPLAPELAPCEWVASTPAHAVLVAGTADAPDRVVRVALDGGGIETLCVASDPVVPHEYVSVPEAVEFPTPDGSTAHAFYYPPVNADCVAPAGERPPLIVISHGGPTAATSATFSPRLLFWTSRGFAVADVNYGGSTGYGRAYRQRLDGAWGIVDVDDCVAAARWLADSGQADPARLIIRGGSAGGYTTLAALTFRPDVFGAAASYYGVSDLEVLARETHKFESRYMERLVGPYPEARDTYRARSPRYAANRLTCPLILFQGLEDQVVPPIQSELMAEAVRAKGLPVAYLTFAGEQHGFRRAETMVACLQAELYFYGRVFGFTPADALPAIPIANLP